MALPESVLAAEQRVEQTVASAAGQWRHKKPVYGLCTAWARDNDMRQPFPHKCPV
jgi:hypothetical protein